MRFSIGTDDFQKIRTTITPDGQQPFYVDKSLFIEDLLNDTSEVIVLPRPRRFGKTLNLSMLKYFFDMTEDNTALFQGLKICERKNIMENWQGKYPVVFISFKSLRSRDFEAFKVDLKAVISNCFEQYKYLLNSDQLDQMDKDCILPYFKKDFDDSGFTFSLKYLTKMLKKHHNKTVAVLIDEYDTPLQEAYLHGFFKEAIVPFRNMLGEVLKGNEYLYKGVVTGITRIAKESLFSTRSVVPAYAGTGLCPGVNNLDVFDITRNRYAQYFGFTEEEIKQVCPLAHLEDLKSWYNGYTFGDNLTIYNPWSVLKFCSNDYKLEPYWINTSTNDLIRDTLTADKLEDVKTLIEGGSITVEIESFTVLDNLKTNPTSFWNLLFMAGFLTLDPDKKLRIPNQEIRYFFEKVVLEWFGSSSGIEYLQNLLADLIGGRIGNLQVKLQTLILETMSFHDVYERTQESFYHGFLLGLTLGLKGRYVIKSNRESGYGRYDIGLYPNNPDKDPGVVIEVKMNQESAEQALLQIQDKAYMTELTQHGCQIVRLYGIHFNGKQVTTRLVTQ